MTKSGLDRLGVTIQVVCVGLWFVCAYLAIVWHPVFFLIGFLPYILIYNMLFRGYLASGTEDTEHGG